MHNIISFLILSLVSVSVAAETRFCVINNVGKDVVLSAKVEMVTYGVTN